MPKKIYIAGPMRGHKFYNFPHFDAAEERLRRLGYDVVNPAALDRARGIHPETFPEDWDWNKTPEGFDLKAVALECLRQVSECDGIMLLAWWERSKGAWTERAFAEWMRIPLVHGNYTNTMILEEFGSPT